MKRLSYVLVIFLNIITISCASKYTNNNYNLDDGIMMPIGMGDILEITTKDEREYVVEVVEVTRYSIIGKSEELCFNEIKTLNKISIGSEQGLMEYVGSLDFWNIVLVVVEIAGSAAVAVAGSSPNL